MAAPAAATATGAAASALCPPYYTTSSSSKSFQSHFSLKSVPCRCISFSPIKFNSSVINTCSRRRPFALETSHSFQAGMKSITRRNGTHNPGCSVYRACCSLAVPHCTSLSPLSAPESGTLSCQKETITDLLGSNIEKMEHINETFKQCLVVLDLDPATAKVAISILGPSLSAFGFLFILRIVMSWYPKLPVKSFPYVIAYAPTEPILIATRKLIPPLGGVDVTPVVWFGLLSFLNEILVGPQGLLVLLSQQIG
ncbi:OLC1v1036482C2 [Oldenlandia corymbosa var. corymbosa]|uniref:OLC1v1036482C2 n=1 Tax=Oldenlandia corymbosa var. corymbosa TaxID=529605 RepID=A0AAV1CVD4_OLDCO|nr:OLC1v1036482C2 [Oldenlandia corymbosa var. corymbosa]